MHSILILFAHPALERSRVNVRLAAAARDLPGVTFHDLYQRYPDFDIDVEREQELLENHDIVVMQHPFFWYSTPALIKEWEDLVLQHGWAYGNGGTALAGKTMLNALTAGAPEEAYCRVGRNRYTVRELLAPLEQTALLCGMDYLPPFIVHATYTLDAADIERHAEDYRRVLEGLRDGVLDRDAVRDAVRLNADLELALPAIEER